MGDWNLVGDIGGTNARLAKVIAGKISHVEVFETKGDVPLLTLIERYLVKHREKPEAIVLAVAGVVHEKYANLTNAAQSIHITDLAPLTQSGNAWLINDFEAAAWALCDIDRDDWDVIQGPKTPPKGHRLIVGAGTGLGVGTLVDLGKEYMAVPGEGGHIGLSPQSDIEVEIFRALRSLWPETFMDAARLRIEAEAVLSGTGLPFLYQAVSKVLSKPVQHQSISNFFATDRSKDEAVDQTLSLFSHYLGCLVGDLALSLMTKGGAFLTGGVILKNPSLIDEAFLKGFNQGGRHTGPRQNLPVYLFKNEQFGLEGAKNALSFKLHH